MRSKSPSDRYDIIEWLYGQTGLEGLMSNESRAHRMVF
jgi:hypothetical protein